MADTAKERDPPPSRTLLQNLLGDRLLLSSFVVCVLLIGYQLTVTLLQPPWIKPVTDWLRAALALLSYAVGRTLWTIADVAVYPQGVPIPSLPDVFFILQYPCFFVALALLPARGGWLPGVRVMVDGLLWISAITALLWYFVLLAISRQTGEPPRSKNMSLLYEIGDLVIFYGLVVGLTRWHRTTGESLVMLLLGLTVASLFVGDTWAGLQLLHPPHTYRAGSAPDLFRFMCYLFLPLAALVRLRVAPAELPSRPRSPAERLTGRDLLAGLTFVAPSIVVVGASAVIIAHATLTLQSKKDVVLPEALGMFLLLLATLRPGVAYLEQERLRRERDVARAQEQALRLANERMEAFLSTVAHELRTPLTSLIGNAQLMARRLDTLLGLVRNREQYAGAAGVLRALIYWSDQSLARMARLVEDVLDETRVRQGRLALRLEACDLVSVVSHAVTEQRMLNPERSIRLVAEAAPVPVIADASRIEQVVANYVSNALKFSRPDQAVEVRVQSEDGEARVSVHDDGVGVPPADQPHIWERFYQAEGVDAKSGSQVGIGIGLHISQAIVKGHQGQVGVESAPGQGTTLWFTLPRAAPRASTSLEAGADGPTAPPRPGEHAPDRQLRNQ
jgi:signal transduction histidine kinase